MEHVVHDLINPHQYFNIEDDETQVVVLRIPQICLIYTNQYKEESLPILNNELKPIDFIEDYIAGNKEIIECFLKSNTLEYTTIKHLIIYKCENVSKSFNYAHGEMVLAKPDDLEVLIRFNTSFNKEYSGEEETYEEAKDFVFRGLDEGNLFVWKNKNHICSIAQVIFREGNDYPEIGHVFTDPQQRKRGFAPSLVHDLQTTL